MIVVKPLPSLALLFLGVPLVEFYFLVKIGGSIGALNTVLLSVVTAFMGIALLRHQGMATVGRLQKNFMEGKVPAGDVLEGIILLVGGGLLLLPGFFTDVLGFLCLIPFTRQLISSLLVKNVSLQAHVGGTPFDNNNTNDHVIDGEFVRKADSRLSKD